MRVIGVDVVFIKPHRNILAYSYFSDSIDQKNNNSRSLRRPDNEIAFPKIQQKHVPFPVMEYSRHR
jgi:hypothetical protein